MGDPLSNWGLARPPNDALAPFSQKSYAVLREGCLKGSDCFGPRNKLARHRLEASDSHKRYARSRGELSLPPSQQASAGLYHFAREHFS